MSLIVMTCTVLWALPAQEKPASDTLTADTLQQRYVDFPPHRKVVVYLNRHDGIGYGLFRDQGTSPLVYSGLQAHLGADIDIHFPKFRVSLSSALNGGLFNFDSDDDSGAKSLFLESSASALFRVWHHRQWQLWAGASLDDYFGIKYNENLENSSIGFTGLIGLGLRGRIEYRTPARPRGHHWIFHGELALMPVAAVQRPGYAYVDNHTAGEGDILFSFLSSYEVSAVSFPMAKTDFGASFVFPSGNQVGAAYRWSFFSTGSAGASRFDEASHQLTINIKVIF